MEKQKAELGKHGSKWCQSAKKDIISHRRFGQV